MTNRTNYSDIEHFIDSDEETYYNQCQLVEFYSVTVRDKRELADIIQDGIDQSYMVNNKPLF